MHLLKKGNKEPIDKHIKVLTHVKLKQDMTITSFHTQKCWWR